MSDLPACPECGVISGPHDHGCTYDPAYDGQEQETIESLSRRLYKEEQARIDAERRADRFEKQLLDYKAEVRRLREQGSELALARYWGALLVPPSEMVQMFREERERADRWRDRAERVAAVLADQPPHIHTAPGGSGCCNPRCRGRWGAGCYCCHHGSYHPVLKNP